LGWIFPLKSGEVIGKVEGEEVYHSSLDPDEYKVILGSVGFANIEIKLPIGMFSDNLNCGALWF